MKKNTRISVVLYLALQDYILIYSEANLLFLIDYYLISCKIDTCMFRILFSYSVYPWIIHKEL